MRRAVFIITIFISSLLAFTPSGFQNSFLEPDEAFKPSIKKLDDGLQVEIKLGKNIDLAKDSIKVKIIEPQQKDIVVKLPPAKMVDGSEVYFNEVKFKIPYSQLPNGKVKLKLLYQGCSQGGICYSPMQKEFSVDIKREIKKEKIQPKKSFSEEERIASTIKNQSLWVILITFFGFGLLLSLTPCVFPMIPILSSIIVGTKNITTKKAFFYSLVYVLAMAFTYTVAGVLAGLFGANLQAAFQNPWIITSFAFIFVALAFSMFGFYEIGLPASIATKLTKKSDEAKSKGGIAGVAVMGFLSALIVGPCVAPPLAGALIYIGQTGDALLGGLALFSLSLGMGAPLLLIGTGAGKFMPKPGGWMSAVSKVFGVIMLGVAIWMLDRILPSSITMLLWAALFIGSAVYLRTFEGIEKEAFWFEYLKKSIGMLIFIYGLFLFFGAFTGAPSIFDPLAVLKEKSSSVAAVKRELHFKKISSYKELQKILKDSKKPVMLDFYADWCVSCKELEHKTFSDEKVINALKDFELIQADVTPNSKENRELLKRFSLFGPPAILFFNKEKELKKYRLIGFKEPKEFLDIIKNVKKEIR